MNEGDVALALPPQAIGTTKLRPVVLLRRVPPFGDFLVCGVSTQIRHAVADFDEVIRPGETDFAASGLKQTSVVRLGFLVSVPAADMTVRLGAISSARHRRLLANLSRHLRP